MDERKKIAGEISELLPTMLRHMYPYVFQPMPIPPSQVLALVSIQERGGCTLTELKKEMHIAAPTISGIIDRLVRDGYVLRTPDKKDRRVKNVVLTAKGEKIVVQLRDNIRKRWYYILTKTPVNMAKTLVAIMERITNGFKDGAL